MPKWSEQCILCGRTRAAGRLELRLTDSPDRVPVLKGWVCKDGCKPTRWEAWKERRQQDKIMSELESWTKP